MDNIGTIHVDANMETCKAITKQGVNKGKQCWRPILKDGYCGKHQSDAILEQGESDGLHKCFTHRCITMISDGKYCKECSDKKEERLKDVVTCKALITQGSNKGTKCTKKANESGYCEKHKLNIMLEEAAAYGKRICDDGKRACKNYTIEEKLKCEDCLEKTRIKERKEHSDKRDFGLCLDCGCDLETLTRGFRKEVQRCEPCYEKLRETEFNRPDRNRNYKAEAKTNIELLYVRYNIGSKKRNIQFELTIEEFNKLVCSPCYYCNVYSEEEVIGVDRVDSEIGYILDNVVPCCEYCNIMKNDLSLEDFIEHVSKIYHNMKDKDINRTSLQKSPSYIRPHKILDMYNRGTLDKYIEICIEDERSPLLIEKLNILKTLKLTDNEARNYIKNILRTDSNASNIKSRKRISKKELFGYLKVRNIDMCIRMYSEVHGLPDGFREDIEMLVRFWKDDDFENFKDFTSVIVKYQNKRNT